MYFFVVLNKKTLKLPMIIIIHIGVNTQISEIRPTCSSLIYMSPMLIPTLYITSCNDNNVKYFLK